MGIHWLGDFVLQSDWMARNKSKNWAALTAHVGVYTATLMIGTLSIGYALLNGVLHFGVDAITSRINSRLWADKEVHYFFVGVGADQFVHYACLLGTYWLLGGLW